MRGVGANQIKLICANASIWLHRFSTLSVQAINMSFGAVREMVHLTRISLNRRLHIGALGCLLALAGCDWFSEPYAYFLFDFKAKVDGQAFSFKSKVVCRKVRSYYRLIPKSFGGELSGDRGFYVSAPDLCRTHLYNQASGNPVWNRFEKDWTCPEKVPDTYIIYAAILSNARGLLPA
ncbi:MAG: hypothetical protein ACJAU6_001632, partial [Alphaproteobacteria bacterium]